MSGARRTLAMASGKGGVGKTTVAVGIGQALAQDGYAVGLLDADLYGPDVPRMLGLTRTTDAKSFAVWHDPGNERRRPRPVERFGLKVWSTQFLMSERQPLELEAPEAQRLLDHAFENVDWGDLDWLIVDLPPGTADVQQHLIRSRALSGAVIVVTPQDVAHLDAKKVLAMLRQAGVPVMGGVENMAPFACPHCDGTIELFPPCSHNRSLWALGVPCLARIPFNAGLARAADQGRPLTGPDEHEPGVFPRLAKAVADLLPAPAGANAIPASEAERVANT